MGKKSSRDRRPFDDANVLAREILLQAQFGKLALVINPVQIHVNNGSEARGILIDESECWACRVRPNAEISTDTLHERCFAGTEGARKGDDIPRLECSGKLRTCFHRLRR